MVDNTSNFLRVSAEGSHDLLGGALKDNSILVSSSREGLGRVLGQVQTQYPGHTGTVETLQRGGEGQRCPIWLTNYYRMRGNLLVFADIFRGYETFRNFLSSLKEREGGQY